MADFSKQWELVGSTFSETEINFIEPSFDAEFAELSISASILLPEIKKTSGLRLQITNNKRFSQFLYGAPDVMWFDVEGVLEDEVTPFDGSCSEIDQRLYLIADERPKWAASKDIKKQRFFRYDDSDTVICDFVELIENQLLRTLSVLTDGRYKSLILMLFEST